MDWIWIIYLFRYSTCVQGHMDIPIYNHRNKNNCFIWSVLQIFINYVYLQGHMVLNHHSLISFSEALSIPVAMDGKPMAFQMLMNYGSWYPSP